jgi:predicted ATPase/class 3 adenylate cyclase
MLTCPRCGFSNVEGARFCSNCGNALEAPRPIEGERKFATILFADVARSTSIAEQLDPEDWALVMNGAFGFMNAAVSHYGGTVSRLMGDAVLALFGAPIAHEDDAERAVLAGLEIQEMGMAYARQIKAKYGFDFDLRVGINTGTAVLAFVGDAVKTEYTAMGDAANVAARLQSMAEPGTVLISAETYRLVHTLFDFRPRGAIEMKGKLAPVDSYEVIAVKAVPGRARGLEGLESPLVGRDREIGILRDRLAALEKGIGGVVAVIGEAGLGKSRLVAELRNLRDALPAGRIHWHEARALSYGMSIPYYPWRTLGRQIIGAMESDAAPVVREKLGAFVERLGLRQSDIPFYETMLAVETEESRRALAGFAGDAIVNGVASSVVNCVKAAIRADGGVNPYVLVMEDLHWADSATLELIAQVATLSSFEPLLIVCVLRPDRRAPSWQLVDRLQASLGSAFERIDLEPLDASASRELLENLLQIEDLPELIRGQILERSEGNPFYLEEVLRSLIDAGQVVKVAGHWRATSAIVEAKIPETLAGVLSSRIDRLPEATKRVAQTAAVIGRVFQHRVLETVCLAAPPQERVEHVEPHIATLSYEQLVRERARDPEREYIFKHALTCEAAYGLLLRSRRKDLHARAGAALETLFADRRDEFAGMLAHHFAEADDLDKALAYSLKAAANARRLFAVREELEHRERILSIIDRKPDTPAGVMIDAVHQWTFVKHRIASYEGVIERLEAAISAAREINDPRRLALALSWLANTHMVLGFPSRGVPAMIESQALAADLGDDQLLLLPLFFGTWSVVDRDPAAAVEQLRDVIDLAQKHDVVDVEGHAMAYRAIALARIGDFAAAHAQIDEALDVLKRTAAPVKKADIEIAVGMAYHDMGELDEGLRHAQEGAELAQRANGLECACAGHLGVGRVQLDRHQLDEAVNEFSQSLALSQISGFEGFTNFIHGGLAMAQFEQGSTAAVERLRAALENARSLGDEYAAAVMSQQLARALIKLGLFDEAQANLDTALHYYRSASMRPYIANALEIAAEISDKSGKPDRAKGQRAEAAELRMPMSPMHIELPVSSEAHA